MDGHLCTAAGAPLITSSTWAWGSFSSMKGSRAKKAAEATGVGNGELVPTAPSEPRNGPARPAGNPGSSSYVQIPEESFNKICESLRKNDLLGPAAADALMEAAGMGPPSPQGKAASKLRGDVASSRNDEAPAKPKKKMGGFAEAVDEIPDLETASPTGRASLDTSAMDAAHDSETATDHPEKDALEPPELNLTPKQNHMRTDLEMWVMDEIPALYGVDDSEELDEDLQEDGQALQVTLLIAESDPDDQKKLLKAWLKGAPDEEAAQTFIDDMLGKVHKIHELGAKKKKKKKKVAEE